MLQEPSFCFHGVRTVDADSAAPITGQRRVYAKIEQGNIPQKRENVNSEPLIGEARAVGYNIGCSASRFSDTRLTGVFNSSRLVVHSRRACPTYRRTRKVWEDNESDMNVCHSGHRIGSNDAALESESQRLLLSTFAMFVLRKCCDIIGLLIFSKKSSSPRQI